LNLLSFTWIEVKAYGKILQHRTNHASFIIENKFVTFGGLNEDGFIGHHIDVCEMDQFKTRAYVREATKLGRLETPK